MGGKAPVALLWIDLETDRLIPDFKGEILDLRPLNVLEVGVIISDFDLRPIVGYKEAVKMTPEAADGLRADDFIREMHLKNGLIQDCIDSTLTLSDIQDEIVKVIQTQTSFSEGELQLAGSGIAAFDRLIINAKLPKIARYLHYAPFDIGVLRRTANKMSGGDIVDIPASYKEGDKLHRAFDDVQAHLLEGQRFRDFFQRAVAMGAHIIPRSENEGSS